LEEKILVVDDEKSIVDILAYALNKEGYTVEKAYDGQEALEKIAVFKPNIIILDLMLPKMNGYDVCRKLENQNIGIIMLTAKSDIVDKILGLELGADDYLAKPFDIREVIARVKSLSRRFKKVTDDKKDNNIIEIKELCINKKQKSVIIGGVKIYLTAMEFELLALLLSNINTVYSREQLLDEIWGVDYVGVSRTVDTHVQRLRKKLGNHYQNLIQTVHGMGYKGVDDFFEGGN
jgi:two-component system alkaline phosphatase synthesis response regulator PhoP